MRSSLWPIQAIESFGDFVWLGQGKEQISRVRFQVLYLLLIQF